MIVLQNHGILVNKELENSQLLKMGFKGGIPRGLGQHSTSLSRSVCLIDFLDSPQTEEIPTFKHLKEPKRSPYSLTLNPLTPR